MRRFFTCAACALTLAVAMPAVQIDLGVTRADISFAYSMNMIGFVAGGVLLGRLVDRRGIVFTSTVSAFGLAAVAFICIVAGAMGGLLARDRLPAHHLARESTDVVKLATGLMATLVALVLSLLISSAKQSTRLVVGSTP